MSLCLYDVCNRRCLGSAVLEGGGGNTGDLTR